MSSTSLCSAGSEGDGVVEVGGIADDGGGGDDDDEVEAVTSAVAVAGARTRTSSIDAKGRLRAEILCVALASRQ